MNNFSIKSLPLEYQTFLFSDLGDLARKSISEGKISDLSTSDVDWQNLYRKKWNKGGEGIKDFISYAEAVAVQRNKILVQYIGRLESGVPYSVDGSKPLERYEDLNHVLEEAYQNYDAFTLITLPVPKDLDVEHEAAVDRALQALTVKKTLEISGPSGNVGMLSEDSIARLLVLLGKLSSSKELNLTFKNLNLNDSQFIVLLTQMPLENIVSLNLENNRISALGAEALADKLKEQKIDFFRIKLDHNLIGEKGIKAFLPQLKEKSIIIEARGIGTDTTFMKQIKSDMGKRSLSQLLFS